MTTDLPAPWDLHADITVLIDEARATLRCHLAGLRLPLTEADVLLDLH